MTGWCSRCRWDAVFSDFPFYVCKFTLLYGRLYEMFHRLLGAASVFVCVRNVRQLFLDPEHLWGIRIVSNSRAALQGLTPHITQPTRGLTMELVQVPPPEDGDGVLWCSSFRGLPNDPFTRPHLGWLIQKACKRCSVQWKQTLADYIV